MYPCMGILANKLFLCMFPRYRSLQPRFAGQMNLVLVGNLVNSLEHQHLWESSMSWFYSPLCVLWRLTCLGLAQFPRFWWGRWPSPPALLRIINTVYKYVQVSCAIGSWGTGHPTACIVLPDRPFGFSIAFFVALARWWSEFSPLE